MEHGGRSMSRIENLHELFDTEKRHTTSAIVLGLYWNLYKYKTKQNVNNLQQIKNNTMYRHEQVHHARKQQYIFISTT